VIRLEIEMQIKEPFMQKKALIVITSHDKIGNTNEKTGWNLTEVTHMYFPLREAGYKVNFASPKGGAAPLEEKSIKLEDSYNQQFTNDKNIQEQIKSTIPVSDVNPLEYQILYFAGGHGTMWDFRDSVDIQRVTAAVYENGGIVSAVCHGPAAFVDVKLSNGKYLVDGKDINCYPNVDEEAIGFADKLPFLLETALRERGALFHSVEKGKSIVIISERLVTGQNPASMTALAQKVIERATKL